MRIVCQQLDRLEQVLIRFSGTKQLEQCSVVEIAHLFRMAFIKMSAITQTKRLWFAVLHNGRISGRLFGCISISNYESHASRLDHCAMGRGVAWHQ